MNDDYFVNRKLFLIENNSETNDVDKTIILNPNDMLAKFKPRHTTFLCWDMNFTYIVQEYLVYKYKFSTGVSWFEKYFPNQETEEYIDIQDLELIAGNEGHLYTIGGYIEVIHEFTGSCFCFHAGNVSRIASLNIPRSAIAAIKFGEVIFAFGGQKADNITSPDIEQYNVILNIWALIKVSLKEPRCESTALLADAGTILVLGGTRNNTGIVSRNGEYFSVNQNLNFSGTKLQPNILPIANDICSISAVRYDNNLYVIYGENIQKFNGEAFLAYKIVCLDKNGIGKDFMTCRLKCGLNSKVSFYRGCFYLFNEVKANEINYKIVPTRISFQGQIVPIKVHQGINKPERKPIVK